MMELSPISKSEAARYMGVKGAPTELISEMLDRCEKLVRERVRPKYVYLETSVEFTDDGVVIGAMNEPLTGNDIRRHLKGCSRAVLLAATLSQGLYSTHLLHCTEYSYFRIRLQCPST